MPFPTLTVAAPAFLQEGDTGSVKVATERASTEESASTAADSTNVPAPMRRPVLIGILLAALWVPQAHASTLVKYGIQDDNWILNGPGKLGQRLDTIDGLGVDLVRFTLEWNKVEPAKGRFNWGRTDQVLARAADTRDPARRHARRHSGLGERRSRAEVRAPARQGLRRVRRQGGRALPVRALLADLERAEPAPLARADGSRERTSAGSSTPPTRRSTTRTAARSSAAASPGPARTWAASRRSTGSAA